MSDENVTDNTVDAGAITSFLDSIGNEELRSNEFISAYAGDEGGGLDKLAQDFVELKSNQPQIPGSPEDYQVVIPEGANEFDKGILSQFPQKFMELGITKSQSEGIMGIYNKIQEDATKYLNDQRETAVKALKDELGDKYEESHAAAQNALKAFGGEDLANDVQIANHPGLFKMLVNVAGAISEDRLIVGGNGPSKQKHTGDSGQKIISYQNM